MRNKRKESETPVNFNPYKKVDESDDIEMTERTPLILKKSQIKKGKEKVDNEFENEENRDNDEKKELVKKVNQAILGREELRDINFPEEGSYLGELIQAEAERQEKKLKSTFWQYVGKAEDLILSRETPQKSAKKLLENVNRYTTTFSDIKTAIEDFLKFNKGNCKYDILETLQALLKETYKKIFVVNIYGCLIAFDNSF